MLRVLIIGFFILVNSLYGNTINIAIAANVSYATKKLVEEFNKQYSQTKVKVTFGSSGKLTAQIKHGAPYHIFMSANMRYPQTLYKEKIAIDKPVIYANGALVFLSANVQNFTLGMHLLEDEKIKRVAIANPKTAPYGKATLEALHRSATYTKVRKKLVFAESASSVVTYAITAADIGIVPKSILFSAKMSRYKEGVNWSTLDSTLYTPIHQGIVLLKRGSKNEEARNFYKFILSAKAKEIFKDYGYTTP